MGNQSEAVSGVLTLSIDDASCSAINFMGKDGWLMSFHADGRITANPDIRPDDVAKEVIDHLIRLWAACPAKR